MLSYQKFQVAVLAGIGAIAIFCQGCDSSTLNASSSSPGQSTTNNGGNSNNGGPVATPALSCNVPAITIAHSPNYVAPATVYNQFLDLSKYPEAKCNDGSPAVYTFQPGFGAASNRWVIYLQGGSICYDQPSCATRYQTAPDIVSSVPYRTKQFVLGPGIMANDPVQNPDFYDANIVNIAYCSSDYWSGAVDGVGGFDPNNVTTWSFQGRAIVQGVISDLMSRGLNHATEVLLTGGSAGGVGAFLNTSDVAGMLPPSTRFLANPDAGYGLNVASYDPTNSPTYVSTNPQTFEETEVEGSGFTLWGGRGDLNCDAAAVTSQDHNNCRSPELLMAGPYVKVPTFIRQSLEDQVQLHELGIIVTGQTTSQVGGTTYMSWFAEQMRLALETVEPIHSYFAQLSTAHELENTTGGMEQPYVFQVNGSNTPVQLNQALGQWYRNPCGSPLRLME